jgi:hypothetical protein
MYELAGEKYLPSNKINVRNWLIGLMITFFIAMGIGRLYALIAFINPIIYLNFLLLAGTMIVLVIMIMVVKFNAKSRNKPANITTALVICVTAWLANWAQIAYFKGHGSFWSIFTNVSGVIDFALNFADKRKLAIGRIGAPSIGLDAGALFICYFIEFIIFLIPAYLQYKATDYYCEDCDTEHTTAVGYVGEHEIFSNHPDKMGKGDLTFLNNNLIYKFLATLPLNPKEEPGIASIELHYCTKCKTNAIVNIRSGTLKPGEKDKRKMGDENLLLQNTYITDESLKLISSNMGLAL